MANSLFPRLAGANTRRRAEQVRARSLRLVGHQCRLDPQPHQAIRTTEQSDQTRYQEIANVAMPGRSALVGVQLCIICKSK